MLTREEEHRLRDCWTILLLERTSSAAALARCHADRRDGFPAYDACPTVPANWRLVQPRDLGGLCAVCGAPFFAGRGPSWHPQVYCSPRCRDRAAARRKWARRRRTVVAQEVA